MALPGLVDAASGTLLLAPNLHWEDVPVASALAERLGDAAPPPTADNEANLAAVAEAREGAGRGLSRLRPRLRRGRHRRRRRARRRRIFRGAHGFGGEFGHMTVDPDGPPCACGSRGCLETRAGLEALLAAAGEPRGRPRPLAASPSPAWPRAPTRASAAAVEALRDAGHWLGIALASAANLLDPQAFVLGGFLAPLAAHLAPAAEEEMRGRVLGAARRMPDLITSPLGPEAAVRGAAVARARAARRRPGRARRGRQRLEMAVAVGLDVGTTAVKAIAVSETGEVLAQLRGGVPALDAAAGLGRAGPRGLVARDRAGARAARRRRRRRASGLSGQMHGLVALDASDAVIRPAILWNDGAPAPSASEIEARVGFERLVELTGNRALPGFTAPKLLWMRTHEPEHYARIAHVLLPKDYVRLRLTGERAQDVADASGTLLLRRRAAAVERRGRSRRSSSTATGCRTCSSRPRSPGARATACRWPPARATRRRARSASASCARARPRSRMGTSGVVFSGAGRLRARPARRACTRSATRSRASGTRWA